MADQIELYDSRHTGPVIDDAVDRLIKTPGTGALTAADVNAAPAGDYPKTYTETLGANSYLSVSFTSKYASAIISCLETGGVRAEYLYSGYTRGGPQRANLTTLFTGNQMAFSPNKEVSEGYKHGFTLNNVSSVSCKVLVTVINGSEPIFEVTADNAYETPYVEWANPPMELGVEYRTTERYLGKPVYVKLVDFGTLANNENKSLTGWTENARYIVRCDITLTNGANVNGWNGFKNVFISANRIELYSSGDQSQYSAYVAVYYTKTTD